MSSYKSPLGALLKGALVLSLCGSSGCAIATIPALWGNGVVLALTVGIFFSTLSLGRSSPTASSSASSSTSTLSRRIDQAGR